MSNANGDNAAAEELDSISKEVEAAEVASVASASAPAKAARRRRSNRAGGALSSASNTPRDSDGGGGGGGGSANLLPPLQKPKGKRSSPRNQPPPSQLELENDEVETRLAERTKKRQQQKKRSSAKQGSQSSLRTLDQYLFGDPALALAIRDLQDDTHSMEEEHELAEGEAAYPSLNPSGGSAAHSRVPSPVRTSLPVSSHVDKVYTEKSGGGFNSGKKTSIKLSSVNPATKALDPTSSSGAAADRLSSVKPRLTPLELGMESQRAFRSVGVFCHGFLAGMAFWQVVTVSVLSSDASSSSPLDFLALYSPLAQPLNFMFYLLTVICTISILDRYDFAEMDFRQLQMLLTLRSGGLAIVVYAVSLALTLTTTSLDDKISLYQLNSTWFEETDQKELDSDLSRWKVLNLCRCVGAILGWMLVSLRPTTDLLHKHLKRLVLTNTAASADGFKTKAQEAAAAKP